MNSNRSKSKEGFVSKSKGDEDKKFSKLLFHPPSFFAKKGEIARKSSVEKFTFEVPEKKQGLLCSEKGVFS